MRLPEATRIHVLMLTAAGRTNAEIGEELGVARLPSSAPGRAGVIWQLSTVALAEAGRRSSQFG